MSLALLFALLTLLPAPRQEDGTVQNLPIDQGLEPSLAREIGRLQPTQDGWTSEVLAARLGRLAEALGPWMLGTGEAPPELAQTLSCRFPDEDPTWTETGAFALATLSPKDSQDRQELPLAEAQERLGELLRPGALTLQAVKVVELSSPGESGSALLRLEWVHAQRTAQAIAQVRLTLTGDGQAMGVTGIEVLELHLARRLGQGPLMEDLGVDWIHDLATRDQLGRSLGELRQSLDSRLGLGLLGHHGLALGDVDRDGLEDIYVCQPGGMPNLLLMRDGEGHFHDRAQEMGVDFCDPSRSALLLDFDGDGWQDLVLAAGAELLFFKREPRGPFTLKLRAGAGHLTSLAAADFDGDGDLDVFACGYLSPYEGQQVPLPYEDARNGAANFLFANQGSFVFRDVTEGVGLALDNQRFTFAASFWDYDEDGDQDLLVVNDFGANQLWRNDGGRFVEVAEALGVQDIAAGMGCSLGDVNGDGHEDLFVSNMFSSAGRRVVAQEQFRQGVPNLDRQVFLRHAQGNSLFLGQAGAPFVEVPGAGGAQMGRWAWGGILCDLDLDGKRDLYVPAGFVTGPQPDDL